MTASLKIKEDDLFDIAIEHFGVKHDEVIMAGLDKESAVMAGVIAVLMHVQNNPEILGLERAKND